MTILDRRPSVPTIIPTSPDQIPVIARRLLAAADTPDQVVTVTSGPLVAFAVPDEVAARAGFGDGEPVPAPATAEPVKEPPRSGKGSSLADWQSFLDAQDIPFPEDAERGDLIALWDEQKDA